MSTTRAVKVVRLYDRRMTDQGAKDHLQLLDDLRFAVDEPDFEARVEALGATVTRRRGSAEIKIKYVSPDGWRWETQFDPTTFDPQVLALASEGVLIGSVNEPFGRGHPIENRSPELPSAASPSESVDSKYDQLSIEELLDAVQDVTRLIERSRDELQLIVDACRERRITWNEIGDAAGVSSTTAIKRWNPESREAHRAYARTRKADATQSNEASDS